MLSAIFPSARDLVRGKENQLYAADVFVPEKLVTRCRAAALAIAVLAAIASFISPKLLLPVLQHHVTRLGMLPELHVSPLAKLAARLAFTLIAFLTTFPAATKALFSISLKLKLSEKRENINRNLYTALCMLAGFGKGGIPVNRAIELLANSKLEGIRQEFAKIHVAVNVFSSDLESAMLRVALTTPSERLAHFLKGFVSFLERSKNYGSFVEEYLQLDNVNRRIELTAYGEKLKQLSATYVTLVTVFAAVSIIALMMNVAQSGYNYAPVIIYAIIPVVSFAMSMMYYIGSPDKGADRTKKREAMYAAVVMMLAGFVAAYIPVLKFKITVLALSAAASAVLHFYFRKATKSDEIVEQELNTFLMSLYAATQSGESVAEALNVGGELRKRLAVVSALANVRPLGEVLREEAERVKHPFLSTVLYVLGNVVHSTKKLGEVLTALIYEYHRYVEYMKLRKSVTNATTAVVLVALLITAFCMGIVKFQMVPALAKMAEKVKMAVINVSPEQAAMVADDTVTMLAATTPFVLSSISWDFRLSFKFYAFTYALAFAFAMLS